MISNYSKPQLRIRQVLQRIPDPVVRSLNACVIGEQYDLFRYTNAIERAAMTGTLFAENTDPDPDARQLLAYEGLEFNHIVDAGYTKVYGELLEGQLWSAASPATDNTSSTFPYSFRLLGLNTPNKIQVRRRAARLTAVVETYGQQLISVTVHYGGSGYPVSTSFDVDVTGGDGSGAVARLVTNSSGVVTSASIVSPGVGYTASVIFDAPAPATGANVGVDDVTLINELYGRAVKAGDIMYVTRDSKTVRRTVKSVEKETVNASFGTDSSKANKALAASLLNPANSDTASFEKLSASTGWDVILARSSVRKANFGSVVAVTVSAGGTGYVTVPTVTFEQFRNGTGDAAFSPGFVPATGVAIIASGAVTGIRITNPGKGYVSQPKVTITGGGGTGAVVTAVMAASLVDVAGTVVTASEPAPIGGSLTWPRETAILSASGGVISVTTPGAGYVFGGVVNVVIAAAGSGYTTAPVVTATAPPAGGTTARVEAILGTGDYVGTITGFKILDPGSGYASAPTLSVTGGGGSSGALTAIINTGVSHVRITAGSTGYTDASPPTVIIGAPSSGGQPAEGVAVVVGGVVRSVRITKSGSGYLAVPTVTFGSGSATAVAQLGNYPALSIDHPTNSSVSLCKATLIVESVAGDWNGLVQGSTVDGKYGETFTVTVTRGGSGADDVRARVRSASGGFAAENAVVRHTGYGYILESDALGGVGIEVRGASATSALKQGDQFSFTIYGKYRAPEIAAMGQLTSAIITAGGTGYTNGSHACTVTAPPTGGTTAAVTATVAGGILTALTITNAGSGYTAPPYIKLPSGAGAGTNCVITAVISAPETSRELTPVQSGVYTGTKDTRYQITVISSSLNNPDGTGNLPSLVAGDPYTGSVVRVTDTAGVDAMQEYTVTHDEEMDLGTRGLRFKFPTQPTPSQASAAITLDSGAVSAIAVTGAGYGYTSAPVVSVVGDGSGATATAVIANGRLIGVNITAAGSGYTSAFLSIAPPSVWQRGLRKGDVFYIDAVATKAAGVSSIIVLNGQAADISGWSSEDAANNQFDIDYRLLYTGQIDPKRDDAPNLAYEVGDQADGGVLLEANLRLEVADRDSVTWVPVKESAYGRLFVHWRGLVPATSADVFKLWNVEADIIAKYGQYDQDNPICFGAITCLRGSQGKPIWINKVATNDAAGYTAVLRQAERVEGIYSMAPTTMDRDLQELVSSHVTKVSGETWKLWRRAYVGTSNVGAYGVMKLNEDEENFTATVLTNSQGNVRVVAEDANFITRGVRAGDMLRINYSYDEWNEATWDEYEIYNVLENDELQLLTGPASPISPAAKFEIWRPDTGLTQAEYVGERSESFASRRICSVWSDSPVLIDGDNNLSIVSPMYLACEIAGLRAALLPQQGLSLTELEHSLDKAPQMFIKYSDEELNVAAAAGTFIISQDSEDGPCFIRHQLTTDTSSGSLYYEDSVGANLDAMSYAIKDDLQPYIGKRNATPETVEELQTKVRARLNTFKVAPEGLETIGAQLIEYTDLQIAIDPVLKDRINISVRLQMPLPLNQIWTTLYATTIQDATLAASSVAAVN